MRESAVLCLIAVQSLALNVSASQIHASVEQLGGIVQCVAQRESISYFMDVFKTKMDESLDILADAVLNASLSENEVEAAKGDLMFMREMLQPEFISKDVSDFSYEFDLIVA